MFTDSSLIERVCLNTRDIVNGPTSSNRCSKPCEFRGTLTVRDEDNPEPRLDKSRVICYNAFNNLQMKGIPMLKVIEHKEVLLASFYLDKDDNTVRRKIDGYRGRYKQHDVVNPYYHKTTSGDYAMVHIPKTRKSVQLSHLLTLLRGIYIPDGSDIDHVNGNTLDNSRGNLRIVSHQLNCRNKKMHKNNTSGYTGISYNAKVNLYYVRKYIQGIRMYKSAKTMDEAKKILIDFERISFNEGYTERHGK